MEMEMERRSHHLSPRRASAEAPSSAGLPGLLSSAPCPRAMAPRRWHCCPHQRDGPADMSVERFHVVACVPTNHSELRVEIAFV